MDRVAGEPRHAGPPGDLAFTVVLLLVALAPRVFVALAWAREPVWDGHYYAVSVMEALGMLDRGGLVRIGFVHYNTEAEVDRTLELLAGIAG